MELLSLFYSGDPTAGTEPRLADHEFFAVPAPGNPHAAEAFTAWLGDVRDPEFPRALYSAEIRSVDHEVGRLLAALQTQDREDDTAVVVVADHGEQLGEHGILYGHNSLYEETLHVPLIIHAPGAPPGRWDTRVGTVDIAPTLAQLVGSSLERAGGRSLVPLVLNGDTSDFSDSTPLVHAQARNKLVAVRKDDWKLIWSNAPNDQYEGYVPELFNLTDDPHELVDRAAQEPARVDELRALVDPLIRLGLVRDRDESQLSTEDVEALRRLGYAE